MSRNFVRKVRWVAGPRCVCVALLGVYIAACGSPNAQEPSAVEINFSVSVGDQPFACGEVVSGMGSTETEFSFTDMRAYVHDLNWVTDDGSLVPIELEEDGIWQRDGVALLDFEDGCENGTAQMNTSVRGLALPGRYQAIQFSVGVPVELNSSETVLENRGSPLNQSALFWSWRSGYKYVRLDTDSRFFRFHLGAVDCDEDFTCDHVNIPTFRLAGFDAERDEINLDVRRLLRDADLSQNTMGTAPGCMGDPADPDCTEIFAVFGLGDSEESAFNVRVRE